MSTCFFGFFEVFQNRPDGAALRIRQHALLPGEVIEIPQDSDKSWLTLFYSLPKELAEKWGF